jgi:hypothetical protein
MNKQNLGNAHDGQFVLHILGRTNQNRSIEKLFINVGVYFGV